MCAGYDRWRLSGVCEYFCRHTDIPISKGFRKDDILLLLEQRDGKTSLPLLKVKSHSIDMIPQEILEKTDRLLYLPLHWQNEVYGYISLECSDKEFDYERLKDFMMAMSQILGIVRNQSQLYDMYIRDSLTGLYNRRGFYGELASRMKSLKGKKCYIFLASVDLDHLKSINDTHGHGEGDVARRQETMESVRDLAETSMSQSVSGMKERFRRTLWQAFRSGCYCGSMTGIRQRISRMSWEQARA